MRVERAHQPLYAVAVPRNRELQLFQMLRLHEPADEQGVARYLPHETAEVLPLRRLSGAEQLGQRVLVGQLVPMAVVFNPERAHEAPQVGGEGDDGERRGPWLRVGRYRSPLPAPEQGAHQRQRNQDPHRFDLPYVPMSCAEPRTWPSIAASKS